MSAASVKSWIRQAFEHAMRLTPEQCKMAGEHYADPLTHGLYSSFKAGVNSSPTRGVFVVAEVHNGVAVFPPSGQSVYHFKDLAKQAQFQRANQAGVTCAVYQQISVYDPTRKLPKV
jgi:hypothetical protein